jgi:hypothetical protein
MRDANQTMEQSASMAAPLKGMSDIERFDPNEVVPFAKGLKPFSGISMAQFPSIEDAGAKPDGSAEALAPQNYQFA